MNPLPCEIKQLTEWLETHRGWIKSATITEWLGFDKRQIRAIAEHSNGLILSWPGSPGYCHIKHASIDDRQHAVAALCCQANKMLARAMEINKATQDTINK
jgi:hypothetical protein